MKTPLRAGAFRARKSDDFTKARLLKGAGLRRLTGVATALVLIAGTGVGSAAFVDYLADRAKLRAYAAATSRKPAEQLAKLPEKPASAERRIAAAPAGPTSATAPDADPIAQAAKTAAAAGRPLPVPVSSAGVAAKSFSSAEGAQMPAPGKVSIAAVTPRPGADVEADTEPTLAAAYADPDDHTMTGTIPEPRAHAPAEAVGDPVALADDGENTGRIAQVTEHVNMRSAPADDSKILAVVPAKASINVLSCKSWCEVEYAGQKGFIYKRFIRNS